MRLFDITLIYKMLPNERRVHRHTRKVILADNRIEALTMATDGEENVIGALVEDLGHNRVVIAAEGRGAFTRDALQALKQTSPDEYVEIDPEVGYAAPVRPSLSIEMLALDMPVAYSDHYLSGYRTARQIERKGVVKGWKFYTAEGRKTPTLRADGSVIVDVAWADSSDTSGCHIMNLTGSI